jgi:hypothetical protein
MEGMKEGEKKRSRETREWKREEMNEEIRG